jgi:hypothetical protein
MSATTSDRLLELIGDRDVLYRGEMTRLAREVGCSREWVRQICARRGVKSRLKPKLFGVCSGCRKRVAAGNRSGFCAQCRTKKSRRVYTLTCTKCGEKFERSHKEHKSFLRRAPRHRLGPFCSRRCSNKVSGDCSYCGRRVAPRWPSRIGLLGAMHPACTRRLEALVTRRAWSRITSEHFPIAAHRDAVLRTFGSK